MKSSHGSHTNLDDKGRTMPVDLNLPIHICQNCRSYLGFVGVDTHAEKFLADASSVSRSGMQGSSASSVLSATGMDHSFVVLPKQKNQAPGLPPRHCTGPLQPEASQSGRAMEESFVVLPPPAASVYKCGTTDNPIHPSNCGFHSTINVLNRAFDIATTQSQVEQPLCLECMRVLSGKLDKEVEDVNRDIESYEACLQQLEGEARNVLTEAEFIKERLQMEEEEQKLEAAIRETDEQCAVVTAELKDLELKSSRFEELEERYWQEFNNFQFQLILHQEKRDAILAKTEVSEAHLDLLKCTNVLNAAFPISHDGDFGTINNFRLGRLTKIPFAWDEINAAWGQACLLLHTMAQHFWPKFQYRIKILPMGSYSRIMDTNNNTYDLFGRVNRYWSTNYDKAMTLFLTCLKDFAEFANAKDIENNIPPEKCFKLPYKIENDKVGNYSITQSFRKPEDQTKALKYTLCNLKFALYWFVGNTNFQPLTAGVVSHAENPNACSSYSEKQ